MEKQNLEKAKELDSLVYEHEKVLSFLKNIKNTTYGKKKSSLLVRLRDKLMLRVEEYDYSSMTITKHHSVELPLSVTECLMSLIQREKEKYELEFKNL